MTIASVTTRPESPLVGHRTDQLFLVGTISAATIRGTLFLLSFGMLSPGAGYLLLEALDRGYGDIIDLVIAGVLIAAGIYGAAGPSGIRYAYRMGVIFVLDNIAYCAGVLLLYRGQDAPMGFPIALIGLQIPLIVIAALLIRRAHRNRR